MEVESLLSSAHQHQINQRWSDALLSYDIILREHPDEPRAVFGIAQIAKRCGQQALALQLLSKIIRLYPEHARALECRGQLLKQLNNPLAAITDISKAIDLGLQSPELYNTRGVIFAQLGKFDQAIEDFTAAINRHNQFADAFYNRALAYRKTKNYLEAIANYTATIRLKPDHFQAYNNRGFAYRELGRFNDAIKDFIKSSKINGQFHEGYWNASLGLLAIGEYEKGWRLYEYRWSSASFTSPRRNFPAPIWLGKESLNGKTILLHSEQGLGDTLQFCRYVPLVEKLGGQVILEVEKPLIGILQSLSRKVQIIEKSTPLPDFDYHCPLMSLPLAFATTLETIPSKCPYLTVNESRVKFWKAKLGSAEKPRVGVVWRGNSAHANDFNRSISLHYIVTILSPEIDWISLQKDPSPEETETLKKTTKINNLGDVFTDFAETGAICKSMDAILSVDTSIAHLGGALGVPVFLLLPYIADARWFLDRNDSPWYPNTNIFRQTPHRDWTRPIQEANREIIKMFK